jgi:hypothetical protein
MRKGLLLLLCVLAACSGGTVEKPREICGNGKDDDNNGKTDCDDADCAGQPACVMMVVDAGFFGNCSKCGAGCAKQSECLTVDYSTDTPMAECIAGRCQLLNKNVQVAYELDTMEWAAFAPTLRSMQTRMVSKVAVDGSVVSCATVAGVAAPDGGSSAMETDADRIEKNGKFNVRGFDVTTLNQSGGVKITNPFFNVGTGGNFLIWTELWGGPRGTLTKLPTGNRYGWDCFESGIAVDPVVLSDDCGKVTDGGVCRTIRVKIKGPL